MDRASVQSGSQDMMACFARITMAELGQAFQHGIDDRR